MPFLLRAALVIGALSYMAATRDQPGMTKHAPDAGMPAVASDSAPPVPVAVSDMLGMVAPVSAAWSALPADARQRLAQEAVGEIRRRIAPASASRDTLADTDRKAAWRGAVAR